MFSYLSSSLLTEAIDSPVRYRTIRANLAASLASLNYSAELPGSGYTSSASWFAEENPAPITEPEITYVGDGGEAEADWSISGLDEAFFGVKANFQSFAVADDFLEKIELIFGS